MNINNTRFLKLVSSTWKELEKGLFTSYAHCAKSDLINRVSLTAIKQGTINYSTKTKKQIRWLAQKISKNGISLYNAIAKKVTSAWKSINKPPVFKATFANDPTKLSFFPRYKSDS